MSAFVSIKIDLSGTLSFKYSIENISCTQNQDSGLK